MDRTEKEEFKAELRQIVGVAMDYFKDQVMLVAEQYGSLIARMDGMDAKIDSQGVKLEYLTLEVGILQRDMKTVKTDIATMKVDILTMKADIKSVKNSFTTKADQSELIALNRRVGVLERKR